MEREQPAGLRSRRQFLAEAAGMGLAAAGGAAGGWAAQASSESRLNVVFVFADQWRAQATGYGGDPNVKTPNLDALARNSVRFTAAVAPCPVCSPTRGSLITGQYPLRHGVFINDVHLPDKGESIADAFKAGGYETAYIGKWHLNGRGRLSFIPRENRQGFDHWAVCECTHEYNRSIYYGDDPARRQWEGYDATAQTRAAGQYIRERGRDGKPFFLMMSWGPPHNPYGTAPAEYRAMYKPGDLTLRANVPAEAEAAARRDLAGYYAHCSALDACVGELVETIRTAELAERTLLVFTSDHGDMLGSHGQQRKQRPWDESILVPLLMHGPGLGGGREVRTPFSLADAMPTVLGLCGLAAPARVQGIDFSPQLRGTGKVEPEGTLIACYSPFGEWTRGAGGREYRGLRTERYTYVRDLRGPWLLYDNEADPYQMRNRVDDGSYAAVRRRLDEALMAMLKRQEDALRPGAEYIREWGYEVDASGTAPTRP